MLTLTKRLTWEVVKTKTLLMVFNNNHNKVLLNMEKHSIRSQVSQVKLTMEEYTRIKCNKLKDKTQT